MLAGSLAERRLLSLVPVSLVIVWPGSLAGKPGLVPVSLVIVWRGSLAGNPGLVPVSPPFRFDQRVEAPGR
jgi:hypothetical protein